jgi:hypothetical protein
MSDPEVSRRQAQLQDKPHLSPPSMGPLYACSPVVQVYGFVPGANIDVEINGAAPVSQTVGYPLPSGDVVRLPAALVPGWVVRVRQRDPISGLQSDWSGPQTVRDHKQEYPAGPPRPELFPLPLFDCGSRTGVGNLLPGSNVWITANAAEVGRVNGCANPQGVDVNPSYVRDQHIRAWAELCGDPSPPSIEEPAQPAPGTLPAPGFRPVYETSTQLGITNIVNGGKVSLSRNGAPVGTYRCWGGSLLIGGLAPFITTDVFSATQALCPGSPSSPPGTTGVTPCTKLPAPTVAPIQAGDTSVTVVDFVSDATITVYVNHVLNNSGGGPTVGLTGPLHFGDVVHVAQDLPRGCRGETVREIHVVCVNPPILANPSDLNLFPVGWFEYTDGGRRKGSVYYPANDDGENQPFNARLAGLGRAPIVFLVHGNHWWLDPSYRGYDYLQRALARMGIIAASVDCNEFNLGSPATSDNYAEIERRADLVLSNIDYFRGLDGDPAAVFHGRIDFGRTGLFGHSRGGETVVLVPQVIGLPGVQIQGVISLAPTDFRRWELGQEHRPAAHALACVLPAGDGDVRRNDGAKFYDMANPSPFKSQWYIHYANHNYSNRVWVDDDAAGTGPAVMSRGEHEQILLAYGCAFFRATLLGHSGQLDYLLGKARPAGTRFDQVFLSHELSKRVLVDNHEERNGIALNSLGRPTSQLGGLSADEFTFAQNEQPLPLVPGQYNMSFFGRSVGMVARAVGTAARQFRTELGSTDLNQREIWLRAAEVYSPQHQQSAGSTGFRLGLEDASGQIGWLDSNEVGGLARPYFRNAFIKTMLQTLRFRADCFAMANRALDLSKIVALRIHCDRTDRRDLAFDDLHLVDKGA